MDYTKNSIECALFKKLGETFINFQIIEGERTKRPEYVILEGPLKAKVSMVELKSADQYFFTVSHYLTAVEEYNGYAHSTRDHALQYSSGIYNTELKKDVYMISANLITQTASINNSNSISEDFDRVVMNIRSTFDRANNCIRDVKSLWDSMQGLTKQARSYALNKRLYGCSLECKLKDTYFWLSVDKTTSGNARVTFEVDPGIQIKRRFRYQTVDDKLAKIRYEVQYGKSNNDPSELILKELFGEET